MTKKYALLVLCFFIVFATFAQRGNKRKQAPKNPKSIYFEMLINGVASPAERYCPGDTIEFDFNTLDSIVTIDSFTYKWKVDFYGEFGEIKPLRLPFIIGEFNINLYVEMHKDTINIKDTLSSKINVDYARTNIDTSVCQGRNISIQTHTHGVLTFPDDFEYCTPWDTLTSASGCDSLVRWCVNVDEYITLEYSISSCDSVTWGDTIIKRPNGENGDYKTVIERIFFALDPALSCDTLKILTIIIIDTAKLKIDFDQEAFCKAEEMGGTITLETNFTAFQWTYKDADSTFIVFEKQIDIEDPGTYFVRAYMDTSLYDTLFDLRIVNCFLTADTIVTDCPLIIPNVFTPDGDDINDVFGIKKLNINRENELTIYDRWGKDVFHQKNYKTVYKSSTYHNLENAFEGNNRAGEKLPEGTYYYAFKYKAIPKAKTYTGTISLIRKKKQD